MSQDEENQNNFYIDNNGISHKPSPKTIKLTLDKSKLMKDLETENADLKAKLTIIAEKEFDRRTEEALDKAEKLGLNVGFISNPEQLKFLENQIQNTKNTKRNSRDIPLNAFQTGNVNSNPDNDNLPITERSYHDIPSMMADLDKEAKKGNIEAQNTLTEIAKKELSELNKFDFVYEGKITSDDPQERTKWTKRRKVGL